MSFLKWRPRGRVGLQEIQQGSFGFRGNPGHDYDTWSWPWFPAVNRQTYFNAIPGNQLPSFNKFINRAGNFTFNAQPSWQRQTTIEQQNAWQRSHSGYQVLKWGQAQAANYSAALSARWQALYYNGGVD